MGRRHNKTIRRCSSCNGNGVVNVLHTLRECLNFRNSYHTVRVDNQIFKFHSSIGECEFCKTVCVLTSMETVCVDCPICLGTGSRTWVDKIMRPYKKENFEQRIRDMVIGNA